MNRKQKKLEKKKEIIKELQLLRGHKLFGYELWKSRDLKKELRFRRKISKGEFSLW